MLVGVRAQDVEPLRIIEHVFVAVGGYVGHIDLVALGDVGAAEGHVFGGRAAELHDRRREPEHLFDGVRQPALEVFEQQRLLVRVLVHEPNEVGGGVAGGLVARNRQGLEELGYLSLGELAAVHLPVDVLRDQRVVRGVFAGLDDVVEQKEQVDLVLDEVLVELEAGGGVAQLEVLAAPVLGHAHQLAQKDHGQLCGHLEHELRPVALGQLADHLRGLLADVGLHRRHRPGGEPRLDEPPELGVLGRVHAHQARSLGGKGHRALLDVDPQDGVLPTREALGVLGHRRNIVVLAQHPEAAGLVVFHVSQDGTVHRGRVPENRRLPPKHCEILEGHASCLHHVAAAGEVDVTGLEGHWLLLSGFLSYLASWSSAAAVRNAATVLLRS